MKDFNEYRHYKLLKAEYEKYTDGANNNLLPEPQPHSQFALTFQVFIFRLF